MPAVRLLMLLLVLLAWGCVDTGRIFEGPPGGVMEVEPQAPTNLVPPDPSLLPTPLLRGFEEVLLEPQLEPARHIVRTRLLPLGAATLAEVQSVELELDVEGGPVGARELGVVFVAPAGFAWERQVQTLERASGDGAKTLRFTLPVAATLITDHGLAGDWHVTTLDEGVEHAAATFTLAP
ncbi:MAG: hypothetical protein Q8L14_24735 [Myxococcales bacterium]|nr:hypothetical protein [Myxococcales bacterium]